MYLRIYSAVILTIILILPAGIVEARGVKGSNSLSSAAIANNAITPCPTTTFGGGKAFPVGGTSLSVTSGDFNEDGKRDIASATDQSISLITGDGNGGFSLPVRTPLPGLANAIDKGDFNNDGVLDLVVTMLGSTNGSVSILAGRPNGGFTQINNLPLTGNPHSVRVGDFNGDDFPDFAVTYNGMQTVSVFISGGYGLFRSGVNYPVIGNAFGLSIRDFNTDGIPDLMVASPFASSLSYFSGRGDGTFNPATAIATSQGARLLDSGDFNGDGKSDIAAWTNSGVMLILLGNGNGTFNAQAPVPFDSPPNQVMIADINADGKLDLISSGGGAGSSVNSGNSSVRLGNGDGTFADENVFASGASPTSVAVDDFDIDGKVDLAFGQLRSSDIAVLRGNGTGLFGSRTFPTGGTQPVSSATADFNGDGRPDMAVANRLSKSVTIHLNDGSGGFLSPIVINQIFAPNVIAVADFNADMIPDIVTGNAGNINNNATVFIHYGIGNGMFTDPIISSTTVARQFHSISIANITSDSFPDVVLAGTESEGRIVVFAGGPTGLGFYTNITLNQAVLNVTTGDFNGDGRIDIAATAGQVAVYLSQPNFTFGAGTFFRAGVNASYITRADFNSDSILDLAVGNDTPNGDVSILIGNGKGGFGEPTAYFAGNGPSSILPVDLNGDGKLDLAVSNPGQNALGENRISVLYGSGQGDFGKPNLFIAGQNPRNVVSADFNMDGLPDLATPNFAGNNFSILPNSCFQANNFTFPAISMSSDQSVPEPVSGSVNVNLTATLSAASSRIIRIKYFSSPDTATGGLDYVPVAGSLVFQPGETSKTIVVPVKSDTVYEYNESFNVFLADPTNVTVGDESVRITIIDDDLPPSIAISDASMAEGNTGPSIMNFQITVSALTERPIVVNYSTVSGSAISGSDFVRTTGILTIAPRTPISNISVPLVADFVVEPDETFTVVLSNSVNATISDGNATGTIINDDVPGIIQFGVPNVNVNEDAVTVSINITRTGGLASGVDVQYATVAGTATADQDYRSSVGTITFGAGETSKSVTVVIVNDLIDEPDEIFSVILSNATGGATLGTPNPATVTILDNDDPPLVSISDVSVIEGNAGTTNADFLVRLSTTSGRTITLNYATANITAIAGSDYQTTTGSLTFTPNALTRTISVPVIGDTEFEQDETFAVNLTNVVNATVADGNAVGTIVNDDSNPTGSTDLVSVNRLNTGSGNDGSNQSSMTPDGRFVAFTSFADNIVQNDFNGRNGDVFVRNMQTGTTTLVSINQNGTGTANAGSTNPVISPDGRYVAFQSLATDVVPQDTNAYFDVYLRDLQNQTTTLVSYELTGNQSAIGNSTPIAITPDARYIVFRSGASNLTNVPDPSGSNDIFWRDMQTGQTKMMSVNITGNGPSNQDSYGFPKSISTDGRYVLFGSDAGSLTNVPDFGGRDFFVRDNQTDTTIPITAPRTNSQMVQGISTPSLSSNGQFVSFASGGNDIVNGDNNNQNDVFVKDILTGNSVLISLNAAGSAPANQPSDHNVMTPDGRFVLFASLASNLTTSTDTNNAADIFLRDLQSQTTRLVSSNSTGTNTPNNLSNISSISPDGRFAVFLSFATNIVNLPDTNNATDIFVRDLRTGRTNLVSINDFGTSAGNGSSNGSFVSDNGRFVAFESTASNLVVNDINATVDVFRFRNKINTASPQNDFDADGVTDLAVFRPSNGVWYLNRSIDGFTSIQFGQSGDIAASADFDGDLKTDVAVFRAGVWYVLFSSNGSFSVTSFGLAGDVPLARDYDGDGKADLAVFRPSTGTWYVLQSSNNDVRTDNFGVSGDWAAPADFDGDGKTDLAVFRPSNGVWYLLRSTGGFTSMQFGASGDRPMPADFDGDSLADIAIWRPINGTWYISRSADNKTSIAAFGSNGDTPVAGDYDGDGKTDLTIFRNGVWFNLSSINGNLKVSNFGLAGDVPMSVSNLVSP